MAYLDLLKGLSSPDPNVQISSMSSIASVVRQDPSPLLLNTVAINVATKFVSAPNRLRLFIAKFFLECAVEMQILKSKREVLELLTSVLDTNDVVAQMMMLRILGALAPVLSGLLDIQHKVLLAVDSKFQRVREMALSVLPALLPSTPNLARHIFHKDLPEATLLALCKACPDDEEAVARAFALCSKKLSGKRLAHALVSLSLRSSHVLARTKEALFAWKDERAFGFWLMLCNRYGCQTVLGPSEAAELRVPAQHPLALLLAKVYPQLAVQAVETTSSPAPCALTLEHEMSEKEYKALFRRSRHGAFSTALEARACKLLKRRSPEAMLCLKLIAKTQGRLYSPELVQAVMMHSSKQILAEIAHVLLVSISYSESETVLRKLDPWEAYKTSVKLMLRSEFRTALLLLQRVLSEYSSSSIECYQWLQSLMEIMLLEQKQLSPDQLEVLSRLACTGLGDKVAFQRMFVVLRVGIIQMQETLSENPVYIRRTSKALREIAEELMYYFPRGPQDHVSILRDWRDWLTVVIVAIDLMKEGVDVVKQGLAAYCPQKADVVLPAIATSTEESLLSDIGKLISVQRFRYPRQFFTPTLPLSLHLFLSSDDPLKVHYQDEVSVEFSCVLSDKSGRFTRVCFEVILVEVESGGTVSRTAQVRTCNNAGVVSSSVLLRLPSSGTFSLRLEAAVVTSAGRKVGKREFTSLRIVS